MKNSAAPRPPNLLILNSQFLILTYPHCAFCIIPFAFFNVLRNLWDTYGAFYVGIRILYLPAVARCGKNPPQSAHLRPVVWSRGVKVALGILIPSV